MKNLMLLATAFLMWSCAKTSPKMEAPTEENGMAAVSAEVKTYDLTPKVDILVVVDNSMSMFVHQENLSKNIDGFVKSFADNQSLDFHFGVVAIWDSVHFDKDVHGQTVTDHSGLGHLLPLKNPAYDPKDPNSKQYLDGARFITKSTPNYIDVMKSTLLVGETPGPAFEELFTPIMPAFSSTLASGDNKDFYRADANLIVVIISDTDDGKVDISPTGLAQDLFNLKNGDINKVSVVGVLSTTADKACPKDNGAPDGPARVEDLIRATNGGVLTGRELDLCAKDFGQELSKIGSDLSVKIPAQSILLPNVPDFDATSAGADSAIVVMTGSDVMKRAVAPNYDDGWSYDPSGPSIKIGTKTKITGPLKVSFTPVHLYNANTNHVSVSN